MTTTPAAAAVIPPAPTAACRRPALSCDSDAEPDADAGVAIGMPIVTMPPVIMGVSDELAPEAEDDEAEADDDEGVVEALDESEEDAGVEDDDEEEVARAVVVWADEEDVVVVGDSPGRKANPTDAGE